MRAACDARTWVRMLKSGPSVMEVSPAEVSPADAWLPSLKVSVMPTSSTTARRLYLCRQAKVQ